MVLELNTRNESGWSLEIEMLDSSGCHPPTRGCYFTIVS